MVPPFQERIRKLSVRISEQLTMSFMAEAIEQAV